MCAVQIKKLKQLSITYHNEIKSGALQSKFRRDTEAIEQLLNQFIFSLATCIISIVMGNGECVESGTCDELMKKQGKFYELKKYMMK